MSNATDNTEQPPATTQNGENASPDENLRPADSEKKKALPASTDLNASNVNSGRAGVTEVVEVDGEGENNDQSDSPPSISSSSTIAQTEPYNHQKQQEIARRNIAYWLVGIVALIVIMSFVYLWVLPLNVNTRRYVDNLILILQIVFTPLITLAGTAIGYYFGANTKKE